jgi:hypothetical protein
MRLAEWLSTASSVVLVPLLLTGCGDTGPAAPSRQQSEGAGQTQSAVPAMPPTGAGARLVSYRCTNGREGTIVVDVPDLSQLADRINRIQPCEYDGGLSRVTALPR